MEDIAPVSHRIERINQLIKEEVGKIILKECDFDKNLLVTITRVDTSSDINYATIFVSVIMKEKEQEVLGELTYNAGAIQHMLIRKLKMKPVPRIRFAIDTTYDVEQRLYDIFETTKKDHDTPTDH